MLQASLGKSLAAVAMASGRRIHPVLNQLLETQADAIIVVGGDGTARTVAEAAKTKNIPIAPLPGGTMNILPKQLYPQRSFEEALAELPSARLGYLDCGAAQGRLFFLSAAIGLVPQLCRVRERFRQTRGLTEAMELVSDIRRVARDAFKSRIVLTAKTNKRQRRRTSVIVATDLLRSSSNWTLPDNDQSGGLLYAELRVSGWRGLLQLGFNAFLDRLMTDKNVELSYTPWVSAESGRGSVLVALDGEPVILRSPVKIELVPHSVPVLMLDAPQGRESATGV